MGWLIDPQSKTVEIYRAGVEAPEILTDVDQVNGEGAVEGFCLNLKPVWEDLADQST